MPSINNKSAWYQPWVKHVVEINSVWNQYWVIVMCCCCCRCCCGNIKNHPLFWIALARGFWLCRNHYDTILSSPRASTVAIYQNPQKTKGNRVKNNMTHLLVPRKRHVAKYIVWVCTRCSSETTVATQTICAFGDDRTGSWSSWVTSSLLDIPGEFVASGSKEWEDTSSLAFPSGASRSIGLG